MCILHITAVQNIYDMIVLNCLIVIYFTNTAEKYEEEVKDLEHNNGRDRDRDNR